MTFRKIEQDQISPTLRYLRTPTTLPAASQNGALLWCDDYDCYSFCRAPCGAQSALYNNHVLTLVGRLQPRAEAGQTQNWRKLDGKRSKSALYTHTRPRENHRRRQQRLSSWAQFMRDPMLVLSRPIKGVSLLLGLAASHSPWEKSHPFGGTPPKSTTYWFTHRYLSSSLAKLWFL